MVEVQRRQSYSTADPSGMEFIGGHWVYAGDKGYRVKPNGDGTFRVVSYDASGECLVFAHNKLSEDSAHKAAARLARTPYSMGGV